MPTMREQWEQILMHLKRLQGEKEAPDRHHHRRHSRHGPSPIVQVYATEMRRHRSQHKG
jgi:hypothetical protein